MTASARPPSKPIQSSPNWDSVGTRKVALICFFSLLWTQTKAAPMSSVYWSMRLDLEDYTVSKWLDRNNRFEDIFPHWMFEFLTTIKWMIFNCLNIAQFWLLSDWLIREGANKKSDHYVRESSWINNKWISAKTAWNLPQFPQFSGKNKEATPWSLSCVFAPLQTMQIGWLEQLESFQWNINKNPQVCCAIKSVKLRHQGGLLWNGSPLWVEEADMRVAKTSTFLHSPPLSHCLLEQEVRNPNAVHIFVTLRLSGHLLRRQISQADKTQMAPLSGRPARTRQWKTIQIRDKWKHPDYALNHQQPDWLADGGWTGCLIKWLELQTPKQGHQLFHHRWAGYRPNVVSAWEPHQETQTAWASWKKIIFYAKTRNTQGSQLSTIIHTIHHQKAPSGREHHIPGGQN